MDEDRIHQLMSELADAVFPNGPEPGTAEMYEFQEEITDLIEKYTGQAV
jgi:hypothetical protein